MGYDQQLFCKLAHVPVDLVGSLYQSVQSLCVSLPQIQLFAFLWVERGREVERGSKGGKDKKGRE